MKKSVLERFIAKYNLAGAVDGVTLKSDKNGFSTEFITEDKHVIGKILTADIKIDAGEYSIYETSALKGLLSVLDDDIDVSPVKSGNKLVALAINDVNTKVRFVLADPQNIAKVPALKQLPKFENILLLDKSFVDRFVRAKAALPDVDTFTVLSDGKKVDVVIGYDNNNTNRVTIAGNPIVADKIDPVDFHARYMREILVANKEAKTGKLEVSSEGIAKITFEIDDFETTYYLPKVEREY